MYETIEALSRGQLFWKSVVRYWPLPIALEELKGAVLMLDSDDDLMIIVVQSERIDGADCVKVQIRPHAQDRALLAVVVTKAGDYVAGAQNESPIDEQSAVNALAQFAPIIRGQWEQVSE